MSKATGRRKSRELALQMLFQLDMAKQEPAEVRRTFWSERMDLDEDVRLFADDLFNIACQRSEEVDQIIVRNARWRMDRMAAVDRNLLRTGVAELLGFPETPASGGDKRGAGNCATVFHAGVSDVHQRSARQRGAGVARELRNSGTAREQEEGHCQGTKNP